MSYKRSRRDYEADLQAAESPFVVYGTPLPPLDDKSRDDGSYVPIWKQDVVDERGRKRLHGAFTGGFSAGYFNTVGSKEGWTPSTFVSSRSNRRKDDPKQQQQRPEDFMDEEDIREQEESQALQTNDAFSGLGSTGDDAKRQNLLMGIFRPEGETMGVKLLRKMGWRDGQGVGAKVRRKARYGDGDDDAAEDHLFAPDNTQMISFLRKVDRKGLGCAGEERLEVSQPASAQEEEEDESETLGTVVRKPMIKPRKGGIGVGVLNDVDDDDEDPYSMGPRISYKKVLGADKKKVKKGQKAITSSAPSANPLLRNKPVFLSKKAMPTAFRKCHDGRLPLPGFVLADLDVNATSIPDDEKYPVPVTPEGWKSSKVRETPKEGTQADETRNTYQSTADAAKASKLDHRARAAMLGEAQLPGKSIFDFLSPAARDRIASATGKTNLPAGRGEAIPANTTSSSSSSRLTTNASPKTLDEQTIPALDKSIALAALGRGIGGWTPYADNPAKLARYRGFLEYRGGMRPSLPDPPPVSNTPGEDILTSEARLQELYEFAHAARVFKPMTGMMASRFTSSTSTPTSSSSDPQTGKTDDTQLLQVPSSKPKDPAEEAAAAGMFGPLTRSVLPFAPTRLLCKRFGISAPKHVQPDQGADGDGVPRSGGAEKAARPEPGMSTAPAPDLINKEVLEQMMREAGVEKHFPDTRAVKEEEQEKEKPRIDVERNEAIEGKRAGEEMFKAIFGEDEDDE